MLPPSLNAFNNPCDACDGRVRTAEPNFLAARQYSFAVVLQALYYAEELSCSVQLTCATVQLALSSCDMDMTKCKGIKLFYLTTLSK